MMNWKEKIAFKGDKILWYVIIMLMIISVMLIYSSTGRLAYNKQDGNTSFYLMKQLGLILGCFGVLFFMQTFSWRWLYRNAGLLLVGAAGLLVMAAFGGDNINGAGRWIRVPLVGITFQPSEFAKIAIVIYTARLLSDYQMDRWCDDEALRKFWMPALVIGLIFLDNFSTSALITLVCVVMFLVGRMRWRLLFKTVGALIGLLALVIVLGLTVPQVKEFGRVGTIVARLTAFFVPEAKRGDGENDKKDYHMQSERACMAIAQGGLLGCGPGNSIQRNMLPHAYSDFIYAIIIEEYGLAGGVFVLLLYAVILFRAGVIGRKSMMSDHLNPRGTPEAFPALLVVGLGLTVVFQALFHMGVNVGALPVTGQTLPMVSLGGTSMWFTSATFGIILCVAYSCSAEGQEAERRRAEGETSGRRDRSVYVPEDDMVDELPEEEETSASYDSRRFGRREPEDEDVDLLDEDGLSDIEEQLEDEGRAALKELRRRDRNRGTEYS